MERKNKNINKEKSIETKYLGKNYKNEILVEILKQLNNNSEKYTLYKNGQVEIEKTVNGEIKKESISIDIAQELEKELNKALDMMLATYNDTSNQKYKITFNNHTFFSFSLYIDLSLMIKYNQIKKLSVISEYEKNKIELKKKIDKQNRIEKLDEYENKKCNIEIENLSSTILDDERNIISFEIEKKESFKLGESRFFSDTIDIAKDVEYPKELEFVGQLNLNDFEKYDFNNLLGKDGILYFFQSPLYIDGHTYEFGKVIYSNNMNLVRKKLDNIDIDMIYNYGLKEISNTIEKFSDRYNSNNEYDGFKNEELNKIYGYYTDCQKTEDEIKKISQKYIVLLQLGSDIYGEGVTTFLITKEDLEKKNFDNIIYKYVQS